VDNLSTGKTFGVKISAILNDQSAHRRCLIHNTEEAASPLEFVNGVASEFAVGTETPLDRIVFCPDHIQKDRIDE
jgi:hypothetical protein